MKQQILATATAMCCAGVMIAAQQPSGASSQTPTQSGSSTAQTRTTTQPATTTLTGCVYNEQDIPGRSPNIAERVGILEDYILVQSSPAGGQTAGAAGTSGTTGTSGTAAGTTSGTTGTSTGNMPGTSTGSGSAAGAAGTSGTTTSAGGTTAGASGMYKLEFVDDKRLQALVGKRVEVMGRVDAESGDRPAGTPVQAGATAGQRDQSAGPDRIELAEFEVTSIREIAGTCPAKPAAQ